MEQNEIREYNNVRYTKEEGAAIIKELDDRTKHNDPEFNSIQLLAEKVKPMVGAVAKKVTNIDALRLATAPSSAQPWETSGYYTANDGGGGLFYWDAASTDADNGGTVIKVTAIAVGRFKRAMNNPNHVNAKWFGAKGTDVQTLLPYNRQVDNNQVTLTQQTVDGIAIDKALDYLETVGGGVLYLPMGIYRTHGYQRDLTFTISIVGDGKDITIIKSNDTTTTTTHGYGIFTIYGDNQKIITLENMTIDGNAHVRAEAHGEYRNYNISTAGENTHLRLENIKSINSPIDCLKISSIESENTSAVVNDSDFIDAYRNVITIGRGRNIKFNSCNVKGGGTVYTGTAPKTCLDVEPNSPARIIRDLIFTNCHFSKAYATLHSIVWADVKFIGCYFDGGTENPNNLITDPERPLLGGCTVAEVTYSDCTFIKSDNFRSYLRFYTDLGSGSLNESQFGRLESCRLIGCGIRGNGRRLIINDTIVENSIEPVAVFGSQKQEAHITNLTLINVLDTFGLIGNCSFGVHPDVEGPVLLNNINCIIDADKWTINPADADPSGTWRTYAFYTGAPSQAAGKSFIAKNLHSSGYLTVLPPLLGQAANASNFRNWFFPNKLPADSDSNYITPDKWHYKNITEEYNDSKITKYLITNRIDSGVSTGEEVGGIIARSNDSDLSEAQQDCASIIFVSEGTISSDAKVGISFRTRVAKTAPLTEKMYIAADGTVSFGKSRKPKEIPIGDWDMTDNEVVVPHGLTATEWKTIRDIEILIRNDADDEYIDAKGDIIPALNSAGITLLREATNRFQSTDYDSTSYNRGFVTFTYKPD